jgi:hypothetical protein
MHVREFEHGYTYGDHGTHACYQGWCQKDAYEGPFFEILDQRGELGAQSFTRMRGTEPLQLALIALCAASRGVPRSLRCFVRAAWHVIG